MNLETRLDVRLWDAISESMEARKFSTAVLDSIHMLSDVIRERSGLEGDGVALAGAAFGGTKPKLKVNRLQTESEQNVQRGIEAILRGIYQAIRNPRSHGIHEDNERDAVAIILFVDYLLRLVDQSRSPFSLPALVARVLDVDFVPNERYATLLVGEIPPAKRLATCRELFSRRAEADVIKIRIFFDTILKGMSPEEIEDLCSTISEELRQTDDESTIRFVVKAFPADLWLRFDEIARMRIENKFIKSITEGKWSAKQRKCTAGALGTWATNIIHQFTLKEELWDVIFDKLNSDTLDQDYVFNYFLGLVAHSYDEPPHLLKLRMNRGLKAGDSRFKQTAIGWKYKGFLLERDETDPWRKSFEDALANFTPAPEPADDGTSDLTDDDIPF